MGGIEHLQSRLVSLADGEVLAKAETLGGILPLIGAGSMKKGDKAAFKSTQPQSQVARSSSALQSSCWAQNLSGADLPLLLTKGKPLLLQYVFLDFQSDIPALQVVEEPVCEVFVPGQGSTASQGFEKRPKLQSTRRANSRCSRAAIEEKLGEVPKITSKDQIM